MFSLVLKKDPSETLTLGSLNLRQGLAEIFRAFWEAIGRFTSHNTVFTISNKTDQDKQMFTFLLFNITTFPK